MATAAAIFSDIAAHNDDEITAKFGELTAMVALSALTGPLIGGKLADSDPQLCLGVSGIVAAVALVTTFLSLEETLDVGTTKNATPALIYIRKSMYTAARPPVPSWLIIRVKAVPACKPASAGKANVTVAAFKVCD